MHSLYWMEVEDLEILHFYAHTFWRILHTKHDWLRKLGCLIDLWIAYVKNCIISTKKQWAYVIASTLCFLNYVYMLTCYCWISKTMLKGVFQQKNVFQLQYGVQELEKGHSWMFFFQSFCSRKSSVAFSFSRPTTTVVKQATFSCLLVHYCLRLLLLQLLTSYSPKILKKDRVTVL